MNTTDLVQFPSIDSTHRHAAQRTGLAPSHHQLAAPVRNSIVRARQRLISGQRLDGSWAGRKSGDVTALSQLVLLNAFLGRESSELARQAARAIERDQLPSGGWSLTPGGPIDLDASVLAYFALKIAADDTSHHEWVNSRQVIRTLGGADAASMATRLWLALLGQVEYECCPALAAEWLLMPAFQGDLTAIDEQRLAALSVICSLQPCREIELAHGVRELFIESPTTWKKDDLYFVGQPSAGVVGFWSRCERIGFMPLRKRALDRANFLLSEAAIESPGSEANFDQVAWQRIALAALGHAEESPVIAGYEHRLDRLTTIDAESEEARSQPETSLTSDTALAIEALRVSGVDSDQPAVAAGIKWLVDHRLQLVRDNNNAREMAALLRAILSLADDLESTSQHLPPDIRMAANRRAPGKHRGDALPTRFRSLAEDLCKEVLVRQRFDGGWSPWTGADSRRRRSLIRSSNYSCGETSSPEATGATLEMLIGRGLRPADPAIVRAAAYLRSTQRGDGSWDSTTGARFLHGTTWALRGLLAASIAHDDPTVAAGVNWLLVHQQACGGWGEAAIHSIGQCGATDVEATAIQTAWAVLALVAADHVDHNAVRRGVEFLIASQSDEGNWCDLQLTVRDSPAGSWYRSDLHSTALPLLALARWAVAIGKLDSVEKPLVFRLIANESPN